MLVLQMRQRQGMDRDRSQLNQEAVIIDVLRQSEEWRVRYQASYWHAWPVRPNVQLQSNDRVYVVGRHNNVLLIQPIS